MNGPEDGFPDWDQVDWGQAEGNVRRLRQRIFAASQAGDLKKVRNLQKLMLRTARRGGRQRRVATTAGLSRVGLAAH